VTRSSKPQVRRRRRLVLSHEQTAPRPSFPLAFREDPQPSRGESGGQPRFSPSRSRRPVSAARIDFPPRCGADDRRLRGTRAGRARSAVGQLAAAQLRREPIADPALLRIVEELLSVSLSDSGQNVDLWGAGRGGCQEETGQPPDDPEVGRGGGGLGFEARWTVADRETRVRTAQRVESAVSQAVTREFLVTLLALVQTICKRTTRTSAARDGPRRHEARTERHGTAPDDTERHEVAGLITQGSLVQIQPAQREKLQVKRCRAIGTSFVFAALIPV
jgi:hypothetical protein